MDSLTWSDKLGHRERKAWLLLVKNEQIHVFLGEDIGGVVVVVGTSYEQNGKWSHTSYRLAIADGVRAIAGHNGWETGTFLEGLRKATHAPVAACDTWQGVADTLRVPIAVAKDFLRSYKKVAASKIDERESKLEALGKTDYPAFPPLVLNTSILTGFASAEIEADYTIRRCTVEDARALVANGFTSAIGHAASAAALTSILGVEVPENRIQAVQQVGQRALVLKLRGRLPEGQILSLAQMHEIGFDLFVLTRRS